MNSSGTRQETAVKLWIPQETENFLTTSILASQGNWCVYLNITLRNVERRPVYHFFIFEIYKLNVATFLYSFLYFYINNIFQLSFSVERFRDLPNVL